MKSYVYKDGDYKITIVDTDYIISPKLREPWTTR